jgi:uncharacterized protein
MPETPWSMPTDDPTEEELEALDLFLDSSEPHPGMPLDAVDGMLACVACGPGLIQPSVWLPAIWGGNPPEFESQKDGQRILDILVKLYNGIVRQVKAGDYAPMVTIFEDEDGTEFDDPESWCLGFVEGMNLQRKVWEDQMKADEALNEMLMPILELADPSEETSDALESPEECERIVQLLADSVLDLRDYWFDHGPQRGTMN